MKNPKLKFHVLFYGTILPLSQLYASPDSSAVSTWSNPASLDFLKVFFVLAVVIVLIWITIALLKKSMGLRSGANGIELAGGISLGARRSIQFVKIGQTLYLLGVTDQQVNLIQTIKDPEEINSIINNRKSVAQEPFSGLLKKLTGKTEKVNVA